MAAILFVMLTTTATAYDVTISDESYTSLYAAATTNAVLCEPATGDPNTALVWANADMPMTEDPNSHTWGWTAPAYGDGLYQVRLFDKAGADPNFTDDTQIGDTISLLVREGKKYFYDGTVSSGVIGRLTSKEFKVAYAGAKISLSCASGAYSHLYVAAVHINKEKAWDWLHGAWSSDPNAAELMHEMTYNAYLGEYIVTLPLGSGNSEEVFGGTVKLKFFTTQNGVAEAPLSEGYQFDWDRHNGEIIKGSFIRLP